MKRKEEGMGREKDEKHEKHRKTSDKCTHTVHLTDVSLSIVLW
jgi:hypothetical protein